MSTRRVLHQFPVSHYCEKTRWNLDVKGLVYTVKNQLPGLHALPNRRLSGVRTVPVLRDGAQAVGDSTAIALYLEQTYPDRSLLPTEAGQRARVLSLDAYFSATFGPEVRRYCYGSAFSAPSQVRKLFFDGYGGLTRTLGAAFMGPVLERELRRMYRIDDAGVAHAERVVDEAIERLESELGQDPQRYLVADSLSLADIAAASLLAPLVGPAGSPWQEIPPQLEAFVQKRQRVRERVAGQWVLARYARDRGVIAVS
jgi:glutathione S-transferase